jgi:hypothetical protein
VKAILINAQKAKTAIRFSMDDSLAPDTRSQ